METEKRDRMTEKYWNIIDEEFISYTGGNAIIISNGDFKFAIWEIKEDVQKICNKLNEWVDENKALKKEKKGFESCSHNWGILYDEAKNVVKELDKENKELKNENQYIKNTIKEMLDNERTEIGKSVLKQLWEVIQ